MFAASKRIILAAAIAAVAYLSLVNLALNLPLTQQLINQHRPDKYALHWERAWSWYPLRVHARGVSVNGQTSSQQYQADASEASVSLSLLPLFAKTIRVYDVGAMNVAFRLRPRPRPDKEYGELDAFFPPIRDRDPESPATPRKPWKEGAGWTILVDDVRVRGSHDLWVHQVRGALEGEVSGNVSFRTRGGPLSVSGGEADVEVRSLVLNDGWQVSRDGALRGGFEVAPFVPSENRGLKKLGFLSVGADIDAPVDSLAFLDFYLRRFHGLEVDGRGRMKGRLSYERGDLAAGTNLAISADELVLATAPYRVTGNGVIDIAVDPDAPETLGIGVVFDALEALHRDDREPLFSGEGLAVRAQGTTRILPDAGRERGAGRLRVTIPSVEVPDLRVYQRYLPGKWGVIIMGGQGSLTGTAAYSERAVAGELSLTSSNADLAVKEYRFETDLDVGLKVAGDVSESASVDISGTYLRLDQARLASAQKGASRPWSLSLTIDRGTLGVAAPEGDTGTQSLRQLSNLFREQGLKAVLASADADLGSRLAVSDLGWVNLLFRNPFGLAISGSGAVDSDLLVRGGWLSRGTKLRLKPEGLGIRVLDYSAQGKGRVALEVLKGGERPDIRVDAALGGGRLKRLGEEGAIVQDVQLEVSAVATSIGLDRGGSVAALDVRIPSARIKDMSVYNQYLPAKVPFELLGGEADLTADVRLEPESARGFVRMETEGLRSRLDKQEVSGRLILDIQLRGGVPAEMDFDISGSSLLLDDFTVKGGQKGFDADGWQARFDLNEARAVWKKPARLDLEAEIEMADSRPIVAMFANQRGKEGWLDRILTVRDVQGHGGVQVDSGRALVPYAMVGSDKIDVGFKGLADPASREGIFYARFRGLDGILKVKDGERNFDLLDAKRTFDAYAPGETPLALRGRQAEAGTDRPDRKDAEEKDSGAGAREEAAPAAEYDAFGSFRVE
jgi:hypothetical protein